MPMIAKAKGRFIPVAPRKIRSVLRLLKGMEVPKAQATLQHLPKGACRPIGKVLDSAVANATRGGSVKSEELVISKAYADGGPMARRFRAAAMGQGVTIRKGTTHLTIELDVKRK